MNIKYPIFYCTSFLNILPVPPPPRLLDLGIGGLYKWLTY